jgi:hypothetical protein
MMMMLLKEVVGEVEIDFVYDASKMMRRMIRSS